MIRRNTWILIVLLAAVIGFAIYFNNRKAKQAAEATPTAAPLSLLSSAEGTPNDIKIEQPASGKSVEVARTSSGTWVLKAPEAVPADQAQAEAAATQVGALKILLGDISLGLDVVGLDKPTDIITVVLSGGKTHVLNVGSVNPLGTGYYVQVDGGKAQLVDKTGLDALLTMLDNPPYAETPTPTATLTPIVTPTVPTPTLETTLTPESTLSTPSETPTMESAITATPTP